MWRFRG
ncbi:hypothetical protein YPPY95_2260, partial [Yersinia pestis PY-95]